ncbi:MAG TPA: hypothetical protein VMH06_01570, partial [Thermodesulfovibrionales bacterium]|nr:hypothetical protein [Thermodesulfovibrionales bacterium]
MKKKGLALLSVVVMSMGIAGLVSTAFALAPYLTVFNAKYGTSFDCSVCHVSPGGGGPRNSYGSAFEAVATHDANPAGAIAAIESLPSKCSGFTNLQLINLGINPGSGTCPAATVPLPTLAQVFPAYAEIASAVTNPNPAIMEPIAV